MHGFHGRKALAVSTLPAAHGTRHTCLPGISPVMVALGEAAVTVTAGPPLTGVAVKVYCNTAVGAHSQMLSKSHDIERQFECLAASSLRHALRLLHLISLPI